MPNLMIKRLLILIAFIFFLSGCGGSGSSGTSVVPQGNGTALVSWVPPTENTDSSSLTDLAGFKIYYGTFPGDYVKTVTINNPGLSSFLIDSLGSSDWFFAMTAFNSSGIESAYSTEASKTIN
jgi:hypothetical protein